MAAKTYMTDFVALDRWFKIGETSAWILSRGFNEQHAGRSNRIYSQSNTDMSKEESFALLQQLIEDNSASGGDFTVYVQPRTGTVGQSAHYRVIGVETMPANSRLAGLPGGAPMVGYVSAQELAEKLASEKRMWELERKLEDMEAAAAESMPLAKAALGQIIEDGTLSRVVEQLTPAVGQIIANFLSKLIPTAPQATVAMSGFPAAAADGPGTDAAEEPEQYDPVRIAGVLNRLRPHFDSHEGLYVYLEKVTDFFEKNPVMAKSFFK